MSGSVKARFAQFDQIENVARNLGFDPGSTTTSYVNELPASMTGSANPATTAASSLQSDNMDNSSSGPGDETKVHRFAFTFCCDS